MIAGLRRRIAPRWVRLWMRFGGDARLGRTATWLAGLATPPYKGRVPLSRLFRHGYVSPSARIHHADFTRGDHVFIGDRTIIYGPSGGRVALGRAVHLYDSAILETGAGSQIEIGDETHIQAGCTMAAFGGGVLTIGHRVEIAPNCAFYPYNHGVDGNGPIRTQPFTSRGGITIGDDVWLGYGVVVLDGVTIGSGAVIGAGSVVSKDIPPMSIACGVPARVTGVRDAVEVLGQHTEIDEEDAWAAR